IVGQTAAKCSLASRCLPESGGDDVADDALLDDGRIDAGSANGIGDDHGAQLRGAEVFQRTEELAGRGSHGGDDYRLLPNSMLTIPRLPRCIVNDPQEAHMAEDILTPLGGMLLTGWMIYTIVAGIQNWHQRRTQAIFQSKMLDKIGSVNELGTFLNTNAGSR